MEILEEDIVWSGDQCIFCHEELITPDVPGAETLHKDGFYACHVMDEKGKMHRLNTVATRI